MPVAYPKRIYFKGVKYGAKKVKFDNRSFDSKLECSVYAELKLQEKGGIISDLECQQTIRLTRADITWRLDFKAFLIKAGHHVFIEAKGVETSDYLIKLKLYRTYGPVPLWIYKGTHLKPYLHEIVIPKDFKVY